MHRSGLLVSTASIVSVAAAAAAALVACAPDSGCLDQVARGWIALPEGGSDGGSSSSADAGAPVARRPPVVVVNGDAGPGDAALQRDDAGAGADGGGDAAAGEAGSEAGVSEAGASETGASEAGSSDGGATGGDREAGAPEAAADAGRDAGPETWESLTCDRICARLLDPRWVIRGCRPPVRGDSGRLYVYCEAAASTCIEAD